MKQSQVDIAWLYEAMVDDDQFQALPGRLAEAFSARSAVVHWLDHSGRSTIDAHSGHFSDAQMADYSANFAEHDLWTRAAAAPVFRNRSWNAADLVSERDFAGSVFYNDWIRAMGDDTYHCAGAVMETPVGFGVIGLHRGKAAEPFDQSVVERLDALLPHLRRALGLRSSLLSRIGALWGWEQAFLENPSPALIVDRLGRLRHANQAAEAVFAPPPMLTMRDRRIRPIDAAGAAYWQDLLEKATRPDRPQACRGGFGASSGQLWLAEFLPLTVGQYAGCAMVTIIDRRPAAQGASPKSDLMRIFALSSAEAEVAIALAEGLSIAELAQRRGTRPETIRSQIKQVQAKTGTSRQSEIVAVVLRLSLY